VHLAGVEDGFVPISYAKSPAEIAEERRLFYVALTRAERELHLTWARTRTFGTRLAERAPSPYLNQVEAARRALAQGEVPDDWAIHFAQARAAGTTITFDDGPDPHAASDQGPRPAEADAASRRAAPPRPPGFERGRPRRPDHHIAGALLALDEADHPLFDALVEWRAHTARAGAVSPTVVLPDAALLALARSRPTDRDALVALGGVGPVKAARYGDRLVELVAEHPRAH
jgi:DNA helicase-2/ATP-dependent DNA helicase PcrA